jgi:hypothetical protein
MEKQEKRTRLRICVEISLMLLLTVLLVNFFKAKPLRMDLQLRMSIDTTHSGVFELFVNNKIQRLSVKNGENFLKFKLPKEMIRQIKLKFAQDGAQFIIRRVELRSLLKSTVWEGSFVNRLISFTHNLKRKAEGKKEAGFVTLSGDAYLVFTGQFYPRIEKLSKNRLMDFLITSLILLILFLIVHNLDFKLILKLLARNKGAPVIILFLAFLLLPMVNHWVKLIQPLNLEEKKVIIREPEFRVDPLSDYLKLYQRYYEDNLIYRGYSVYLNNLFKVKVFNKSPLDKVLLGKNKWLFMARESNRDLIGYFRNIYHFTPKELEYWADVLTERKNWLRERGIIHIFVIVPNKNTIYPEFMPDYFRKISKESRLEQLMLYLKDKTDLELIDLREVLIPAKAACQLYDRTDSHWNDYGGYLAYVKILEVLAGYFPELKPLKITDFEFQKLNERGGDLAIMLSLQDSVFRENKIRMKYHRKFIARFGIQKEIPGWSPWIKLGLSTNEAADLPGILVVHDSFMHQIKPFLSEHFKKVVYIWDWYLNFFNKIITKEKPIIVIEQINERALLDLKPVNPDLKIPVNEN